MNGDVVAEAIGQRRQRVLGERSLVGVDALHADALHEVDGGAETDRLDDRRRAGLELGRDGRRGVAVEAHVGDHVAAPEERRGVVEQRGPSPQRTDPRRPAHLVRREGDEVGAPRLHVGDVVGHVLTGVDDRHGAGGVGRGAQLGDGRERAEHVAHRREGEHLGPVEQPLQRPVGEVELPVGGDRQPAQLDPLACRHDVPRDDVGVVLHLGEHDHVAGLQVGAAPGLGDEVERLGGVLGEDDLVGVGGVDEAGHLRPRPLEAVGGLGGEAVGAAVDRRVRRLGEDAHRVDDLGGLLRRVRRVEVVDRRVVDLALQQREATLQLADVEVVERVVRDDVGGQRVVSNDTGGPRHGAAPAVARNVS